MRQDATLPGAPAALKRAESSSFGCYMQRHIDILICTMLLIQTDFFRGKVWRRKQAGWIDARQATNKRENKPISGVQRIPSVARRMRLRNIPQSPAASTYALESTERKSKDYSATHVYLSFAILRAHRKGIKNTLRVSQIPRVGTCRKAG